MNSIRIPRIVESLHIKPMQRSKRYPPQSHLFLKIFSLFMLFQTFYTKTNVNPYQNYKTNKVKYVYCYLQIWVNLFIVIVVSIISMHRVLQLMMYLIVRLHVSHIIRIHMTPIIHIPVPVMVLSIDAK